MDLYLEKLNTSGMSLMIYNHGKLIFQSAEKGIKPHLDASRELGEKLHGTIIADKIVGRAAAFLIVHARAVEVHAAVLSKPGMEVLNRYAVPYVIGALVDHVLTEDGRIYCPFESMVQGIDNVDEAYEAIINKMKSMTSQ